MEKLLKKLRDIVGKDNVLSEKADLISYAFDASQIEGKAIAIVFPKFTNDVRRIVKICAQNKVNIVPRGAGTGLAGGAVPQNSVVLDFSRMKRILLLDRKKREVVVEPGVVVAELNEQLAEHDLFFPIVPSSHNICTVGGMVATNAAGYRAIKYGKTDQWVEELEVVDGTGKLFSFRKNNDFIGSEGVLGIVTKIRLSLTSLPDLRSMSLITFQRSGDLIKEVKNTLDRPDVLGVEYFDKIVAELVGVDDKYHLIAEFEDEQGEIKDPDEMLKVIELREGIGPVVSSNGYMLFEDPKVDIDKMDVFLEWLEKEKIPNFGHIGIGIVHPRFKLGEEDLIKEMFKVVEKLGGEVSGEHGIGLTKKKFIPTAYAAKIKRLKKKYDPNNILNINKIV